jgi:hypothetical protein
VEQELLTLLENLSSPPVFSGVRVTWSLVLCVWFVDRCLSFCTFSFSHCVVYSSSIYGFWLSRWYLQTLLIKQVTRTPLKTGGELRFSRRVNSSCSTSGTRRVNLVTNPVIGHEWGKDREVFTTSGTYSWTFVTQIFHNGQPSHDSYRQTFEVMTST